MHLAGYTAHPDRVQIAAACDADLERAQRASAAYKIPLACSSLEQLLEVPDWQVGVVCTPTTVREDVIIRLAAAGKHVFVEKPLASGLSEALRMVENCEQSGVLLAVDQNFRWHYPFYLAKEAIEAGEIGKPLSIFHKDLMFRQDGGWRIDCDRHALNVMGVHWLDGFRWILQDEAASLSCRAFSSPAIQCAGETDAHIQIAFNKGVTATYVESFSSPLSETGTLILGKDGCLALDYGGMSLYTPDHRTSAKQQWTSPYAGAGKPESAFRGLDELLNSIDAGKQPGNSGRDNLNTIALIEGAYLSAAEGRTVTYLDGVPR